MSWDLQVFHCGGKPPVPGRKVGAPPETTLGVAVQVRAALGRHLPGIIWTDPTWGIYYGEDFLIEFDTGRDDPIGSLSLHVRGGREAIPTLLALARGNGWS
jgi:hypothetical protein